MEPSKTLIRSISALREQGVPVVKVASLKPWEDNPRVNAGAVPAVIRSMQRFGWTNPILIRESDGFVEAGHTRLLAATHLGLDEVPVVRLEHSERDARLYAVADNRTAEFSEWAPNLADILVDFDASDILAAGFESIDEAVAAMAPAEPEKRAPREQKRPDESGDESGTWSIHKGDSLEWLRSLPAKSVDLVLTDPPYFGVVDEDWDNAWDSAPEFLSWCGEVLDELGRVLRDNGTIYWYCSPGLAWEVEGVFRERFEMLANIRWEKPNGRAGVSRKESFRSFFADHETILMGEHGFANDADRLARDRQIGEMFEPIRAYLAGEWKRAGLVPGDVRDATGTHMAGHYFTNVQWELPTRKRYEQLRQYARQRDPDVYRRTFDDLRAEYEALHNACFDDLRRPFFATAERPYTSTWRYSVEPPRQDRHPCQKPIAMIEHMVLTSSRPGDVVLDAFTGSGSTAVAAVRNGRNFIGCEADERWHRVASDRICAALGEGASDGE